MNWKARLLALLLLLQASFIRADDGPGFLVKVGVMERSDAARDVLRETKRIMMDPSRRPGWCFLVDPPNSHTYEVYSVHYLPQKPQELTGDFDGKALALAVDGIKTASTQGTGIRPFCFDFDSGDPLGEYRVEVFIDGELTSTLSLEVVARGSSTGSSLRSPTANPPLHLTPASGRSELQAVSCQGMESLHAQITTLFGQGERPHENELVLWDGFDQFEKEDAVRFYAGKTWPEVLAHLRGLKDAWVFRAAYYLEEWSVLSPSAMAYHTRAHLEFLCETLASGHPDEEFVVRLLGQLYQVAYMHKGSPFNVAQTDLLRRIAEQIGEKAAVPGLFEYPEDVKRLAKEFLAELKAHDN